jgi:hypothetical protein
MLRDALYCCYVIGGVAAIGLFSEYLKRGLKRGDERSVHTADTQADCGASPLDGEARHG